MKKQTVFLLLPLILAAALFAGCSTVNTYPMQNAFSANGAVFSGGPPVTLRPIEDSMETNPGKAAPYKADPNYLGEGLAFMEVEVCVPIVWYFNKFQADCSRADIVRSAVLSKMKASGIPVVVKTDGDVEPSTPLPEDRLSVLVRIREMSVNTALNGSIILLITDGFTYKNQVAHVVLDLQFWQPGQAKPIWEGAVEGTSRTSTKDVGGYSGSPDYTFDKVVQRTNVVKEAVSAAAEQCVAKLAETRTAVCNQRYAKLMKDGSDLEADGDTTKAMEAYGQASISATTAGQDAEAMQALVRLLRVIGIRPALPEEARKLKVQAEAAFRDGRFDAASQLYGETLNIAPWWAEGHSELGLLLGASGHYSQAIREMKRYVALAPNAPDIRNAQDKIYEWEQKLSSPTPAAATIPPIKPSRRGGK